MIEHKDILGRVIKVGDRVLYAGKCGNSPYLSQRKVVGFTDIEVLVKKVESNTKHKGAVFPERLVVIDDLLSSKESKELKQ